MDGGLRPGRLDRFREAGQAIAADDEDIVHASVLQLGADPGPELRALGGLHPNPQDVLDPVEVDADGDVRDAVLDLMPVAGSVPIVLGCVW